ncbi:MAG: hypothetical protein HYX32_12190 [Actinobacteria bacterium]|nr:hypothetical protein [Actinomycetota bacterium]
MARRKPLALAVALAVSLAVAGSVIAQGGEPSPNATATGYATEAFGDDPTSTTPTAVGTEPGSTPASAGSAALTGDDAAASPTGTPPVDGDGPRTRSSDQPPPGGAGAAGTSTRQVLPGAGGPPPTEPADPIGDLGDHRPVPAALDFKAPPEPAAVNGYGGPGGLAVAPSCSHQCITRGVAYARGFGAELIVETSMPATLLLTAVADLDGSGDYETVLADWSPGRVSTYSWALDHLQPGQTYYVMAAATDEDDRTAYAWGEFTTLSRRDVFVEFGDTEVFGGPGNISQTTWILGLDGPLANVAPGEGILLYKALPRFADLDFWLARSWEGDICEGWWPSGEPSFGHYSDSCVAWNAVGVDGIDLDTIPAGKTRWTQTSASMTLRPPTGAGNALPPGYGDPYYFSFQVPLTLYVTYS